MKRFAIFFLVGALCAVGIGSAGQPNVLFILSDDLGYGDLQCYSDRAKVSTPHLDRLAAEGIQFMDAHSPSTVCTPSRYGFMTGHMPFRLKYRGVFTGVGGPCLIKPERLTIAEMFKEKGYTTAMFGKWHIGMTFYDANGKPIHQGGIKGVERIDYSREIDGGPIDHGFDQFYGTVSCPTTDYLYAFIENKRIPVPPKGLLNKEPLPKNPYTRDNRLGYVAPNFDLQEVDTVFLNKSIQFIENHAKASPEKPFFLFHSTQAVHLPSFPGKAYRGKSNVGPHGDFILQLDDHVGKLMATLKKTGLAENTLVIFTSDNGPEVPTIIAMRRDHDHDGAHPWRGVKRDNWEGGHRVPFIAHWPAKIKAGSKSTQTLCFTDVMATCADILDYDLPNNAAEDSYSLLPILEDPTLSNPIRPYTIHQTMRLGLAIRAGKWKYLDHKGSAGNNYNRPGEWGMKPFIIPDTDPKAPGQLYNLETDPGETRNLYSKHPEIVTKLKGMLEASKKSGRSAPTRD